MFHGIERMSYNTIEHFNVMYTELKDWLFKLNSKSFDNTVQVLHSRDLLISCHSFCVQAWAKSGPLTLTCGLRDR